MRVEGARGAPFIAPARARVSGTLRRENAEGRGQLPRSLLVGSDGACGWASVWPLWRSRGVDSSAGRRGDTGEGVGDVAALGWADGRSGSPVSSRPRRGPAALQRTGQGRQWAAAARHDGSPASRRGEGEREVRGGLPRVTDWWVPGCVGPGKWVSGLGRK